LASGYSGGNPHNALVETLGSWEAIESHINVMVAKKKTWCPFIFHTWQGHRVSHDDRVIKTHRVFREALKVRE
jgi:hypothetical protein